MLKPVKQFYILLLPLLMACTSKESIPSDPVYYSGTESTEVSYSTSDEFMIYADLIEVDKNKKSIILFHQAGANARSEYRSIVPKLREEGYNVLVVDQRSGGQRFGEYNRTVAKLTEQYEYCDAYPDFVASVEYLRSSGFTGDIIAWGSSYSAALVIQLAHNHDEVSAAIAFSPASGGPMEACTPNPYIETINKPLMVLRPAREMEVPSVVAQFELAKASGRETYVAENGVHGSSMLDPSRTKADVSETWEEVLLFLGGK